MRAGTHVHHQYACIYLTDLAHYILQLPLGDRRLHRDVQWLCGMDHRYVLLVHEVLAQHRLHCHHSAMGVRHASNCTQDPGNLRPADAYVYMYVLLG